MHVSTLGKEQKICQTPDLPTLGWPRHRDDGPIRRLVVFVGAVLWRRRPWSRSSLRLRESSHFETAFFGHDAVTADCHVTTEVAVLLTLYVVRAATHADRAWQSLRCPLCRPHWSATWVKMRPSGRRISVSMPRSQQGWLPPCTPMANVLGNPPWVARRWLRSHLVRMPSKNFLAIPQLDIH